MSARTFVKFEAIKPDFSRPALVDELLDHAALSVLYGAPGAGKTFLALDLGLHVALGWRWLERDVEQGAVLYVAAEGGASAERRVAAFRQHYELEGQEVPFWLFPGRIDLFHNEDDVKTVIRFAKQLEDAGFPLSLVQVDTVARAMNGGDEDRAKDMGKFVGHLDMIRQEVGTHVQGIHHTGKDESRGMRGSSALLGAVDSELFVEKVKDRHLLSDPKQRDYPTNTASLWFKLAQVELGQDCKGKPVTSCVVESTEALKRTLGNRERHVLEALERLGPVSLLELRKACDPAVLAPRAKAPDEAARKAFHDTVIPALVRAGKIEVDGANVWLRNSGDE